MVWKLPEICTSQKVLAMNFLEEEAFLQGHQNKTIIVYEWLQYKET